MILIMFVSVLLGLIAITNTLIVAPPQTVVYQGLLAIHSLLLPPITLPIESSSVPFSASSLFLSSPFNICLLLSPLVVPLRPSSSPVWMTDKRALQSLSSRGESSDRQSNPLVSSSPSSSSPLILWESVLRRWQSDRKEMELEIELRLPSEHSNAMREDLILSMCLHTGLLPRLRFLSDERGGVATEVKN